MSKNSREIRVLSQAEVKELLCNEMACGRKDFLNLLL